MSRRSTVLAALATVVAIAVAAAVLAVWQPWRPAGPECRLAAGSDAADGDTGSDTTGYTLTAAQLQHTSTINAVGLARGLGERARIIALATAWQESSMRNIDHGDRDSLGLFQQRPSQGWGEPAELMDPVYAAGAFYDALERVADVEQLSLTEAAQAVQRSAFPDAYAKWEPMAAASVAALAPKESMTLSCRAGALAPTSGAPARAAVAGAEAAAPALAELLAAANAELGGVRVVEVTAEGTAAVVHGVIPSLDPDGSARALAAWVVAHAAGAGVAEVRVAAQRYARHTWGEAHAALPEGQVAIVLAR